MRENFCFLAGCDNWCSPAVQALRLDEGVMDDSLHHISDSNDLVCVLVELVSGIAAPSSKAETEPYHCVYL